MEIDPYHQKTLPDFLLTEKMLGSEDRRYCRHPKKMGLIFITSATGKRLPIERIYNRAIVDELERKNVQLSFDWRDDLDVEWAGHPNWYFRISKFSIPYLMHPSVPKTWFFWTELEGDSTRFRELCAEAALFFCTETGGGNSADGNRIRRGDSRREAAITTVLQERMHFEPVIATPFGGTKAEVRVMYIWLDKLTPVLTIIRMGRGLMMGVDHNKNMEWVGASAGLYLDQQV